jgi:hypothetical protein
MLIARRTQYYARIINKDFIFKKEEIMAEENRTIIRGFREFTGIFLENDRLFSVNVQDRDNSRL